MANSITKIADIINPLPYDVEVNGRRYPVHTGHRAWIEFESVLEKQTDFT